MHGKVGAALKKAVPKVCKREDIFITSKLWNNSHAPEDVGPALDEILEQLGLDYLDLLCESDSPSSPPHLLYTYADPTSGGTQ